MATGRMIPTTTTYKTTVPKQMLTWINPSTTGITTTHKTPTIVAQAGKNSPTRSKPNVGFVVIPYTKGISESFRKICGKYGIQTYFRGNTTNNSS